MIWIEKLQQAIDFIEGSLFEPINAEAVGRAINYAPSSFSNFFSAVTGYSVGEYIRFRRLSEAAQRLAKEEVTVTEMAFECGYETVEAFSKAFKRFTGYAPSQLARSEAKYQRFSPITINFSLKGGFGMTRNFIPGLQKVDWSDTRRQSEYVNSVISALGALGETLSYDYVCAVSGSAFRTSFSMEGWNHGNYHVINTPQIIEHTFNMLGYEAAYHPRGSYEADSRRIIDSIDRGVPVITIEGVINCADTCVISGYDNDGQVLLGYNPFMYIEDDHKEAPDGTGYFRKSDWYDGHFGGVVIIGEKRGRPGKEYIFAETIKLVSRLIREEVLYPGQHNGLAAHRALAGALMTYEWEDNGEPYLNVMCNYKQYLDRQYAVPFFEDNGRGDLADIYRKIAALCAELGCIIPQDFSADKIFSKKKKLKPYCDVLMDIHDLEQSALRLLG